LRNPKSIDYPLISIDDNKLGPLATLRDMSCIVREIKCFSEIFCDIWVVFLICTPTKMLPLFQRFIFLVLMWLANVIYPLRSAAAIFTLQKLSLKSVNY
jgi:hypothetical protein